MTKFRDLRVQNGYSQEEFRKLYNEKYNRNYTSAAISMIERGKRMPELGALVDFADFYGVSLDYLLGRSVLHDESQLSVQIKSIVENLDIKNYARQVDGEAVADSADETEVRENKEMLRCLLKQSAVLAKRMEKMEQEKTCAKPRNMV